MLATEPATQIGAADEPVTPVETQPADAAVALTAAQPGEFGDADFIHVVGYGALFGIPTMYLVALVILQSMGTTGAFAVSFFVAFWAGPFAGGVVMLARRGAQLDHELAPGGHPS